MTAAAVGLPAIVRRSALGQRLPGIPSLPALRHGLSAVHHRLSAVRYRLRAVRQLLRPSGSGKIFHNISYANQGCRVPPARPIRVRHPVRRVLLPLVAAYARTRKSQCDRPSDFGLREPSANSPMVVPGRRDRSQVYLRSDSKGPKSAVADLGRAEPGIHSPCLALKRSQGVWIPALASLGRNDSRGFITAPRSREKSRGIERHCERGNWP